MNWSTQLLQSTCPQGLASVAREEFVSPLLQAGHILWGILLFESVSSEKLTVMRLCSE